MSTYVKTLKNSNGDIIYPRTKTTAIYDNNNVGLQTILDNLQTAVDTPQFSCVITTLQYNEWNNYSQTLTIPGVTATNLIIISPAYSSSREYQIHGVYAYSQSTDSVTFMCNIVPSKDIVIYIVIINTQLTDYRPQNWISVVYDGNLITDGANLGNIGGSVSFNISSDRDLSDILITGTNIDRYYWSGSNLTIVPNSYYNTETSVTLLVNENITHVGYEISFSWTAKQLDYITVEKDSVVITNGDNLGDIFGDVSVNVSSNVNLSNIVVTGTNINSYSWSDSTLTIVPEGDAGENVFVVLTVPQSTTSTGAVFEFAWIIDEGIIDTITVYRPYYGEYLQNGESISLTVRQSDCNSAYEFASSFYIDTNVSSSDLVVTHSNLDDVDVYTEVMNENRLYLQVYKSNSNTTGIFTVNISTPSQAGHVQSTFSLTININSGFDIEPV